MRCACSAVVVAGVSAAGCSGNNPGLEHYSVHPPSRDSNLLGGFFAFWQGEYRADNFKTDTGKALRGGSHLRNESISRGHLKGLSQSGGVNDKELVP